MSGFAFRFSLRHVVWLLIPFMLLSATGCSTFSDLDLGSKVNYQSASKAPSLEVPPDLNAPEFDQHYMLSGKDSLTSAGYDQERVAANGVRGKVLPTSPLARIERAAGQRWLVVNASPEVVWKATREFWLRTGFNLVLEQPELGIMETDWAENRAKIPQDIVRRTIGKVFDFLYATGERDKFRTRIEPGVEPGTSEIYISHRGMVELGDSALQANAQVFRWQPRPADPELEIEMLRRLLLQLGFSGNQAQTIVATAPIPTTIAPTLGVQIGRLDKEAEGGPLLLLEDAFDRAWRRVGLALDRGGFTVVDRDRSKGVYYVRYANIDQIGGPKKQRGSSFWSKLAFWTSSEDATNQPEQYRVFLQEQEGQTKVVVQNREGNPEKSELALQILTLLQGQLQ